jgi:CHAD domain-containing protein
MSDSESISTRPALRELLRDFIGANNAEFLQYATSPQLPDSFQGIHKMRVAAKRIRSVYRLMEWLAPEHFDARHAMRGIRKYFKLAGAVRDLQIHEHLLGKYGAMMGLAFPRYETFLRGLRLRAQRKLAKRLPSFEPFKLTNPADTLLKLLDRTSEEALLRHAKQNVALRTEDMSIQMPPDDDPKRLHAVRILLKENLYVMSQVNASIHGPVWPESEIELYKQAAETAGDWHDLDVFMETLVAQQLAQPRLFPDRPAYDRIIEKLSVDKAKALKRYHKQIRLLLPSPTGHPSKPPTPEKNA